MCGPPLDSSIVGGDLPPASSSNRGGPRPLSSPPNTSSALSLNPVGGGDGVLNSTEPDAHRSRRCFGRSVAFTKEPRLSHEPAAAPSACEGVACF